MPNQHETPASEAFFNSIYETPGVWVIYQDTPDQIARYISSDSVMIIRNLEYNDRVCWWPKNLTLDEAIKLWEKRDLSINKPDIKAPDEPDKE